MQKQQKRRLIEFEPTPLDPSFPVDYQESYTMEAENDPLQFRHIHDALEIGICRSGYGVFIIGTELLPFSAGDISIMPARVPHWCYSARGVRNDWTWFFLDPLRLLGRYCSNTNLLKLGQFHTGNWLLSKDDFAELYAILEELWYELRQPGKFHEDMVRGYLLTVFGQLSRVPEPEEKRNPMRLEFGENLLPALNEIHTRYYEKLSVDDLAHLCNMSPTSFRDHFNATVGCSPYQYLLRYRISMASVELLQGNKTLEVIAAETGFPTLSCFVRQFTKQKGMPPRRWAVGERGG